MELKKQEKWYRISSEFKVEEVDNPELNKLPETKFWLNKQRISIPLSDKENYQITVYDASIDKTELRHMNLRVIDVFEGKYYGMPYLTCKAYDRLNVNRKLAYNEPSTKLCIVQLIKFLFEFGSYNSWESIELRQENIELKRQVENLSKQIKRKK